MSTVDELISHRGTLALMVRQDLKSYYGRYRLGLLWTMIEPFMQALFMWIVFAFLFGSTKGIAYEPFSVYLVTGLLPLGWLTSSVSGGPKTFRKYGQALATSRIPTVSGPCGLWSLRWWTWCSPRPSSWCSSCPSISSPAA